MAGKNLPSTSQDGSLPKLSNKRKAWLALYLDMDNSATFFNGSACTRQVYNVTDNKPNVVSAMSAKLLSIVRPYIDVWLNDLCFTEDFIKAKIFRLMNAKETKLAQHLGKFTDSCEVEALDIQLKAASLAADVKGMKKNVESGGVKAIFNLNFGSGARSFSATVPGSVPALPDLED